MFPRLAEHYRSVVEDLVMSLQALASSLQSAGITATCYSCGDRRDGHGASFVADIGDGHMVRFLVSDFGISWVESRNGRELVKLEGGRCHPGIATDGRFGSGGPGPQHAVPGPSRLRSGGGFWSLRLNGLVSSRLRSGGQRPHGVRLDL